MSGPRAPKQWSLTTEETTTSFESWRQNLTYVLSLDPNFTPYITATWLKKTAASPNRGFVNDGDDVPEGQRKTAAQKAATLELMLGQVANYCTIISRNTIIKNSTSLDNIWQLIRQHYGFQRTGAHFLNLADIRLKESEKPEDLYQRFNAFFEDVLLTPHSGLTHHGDNVTTEEDLTPTLENTIVLLWLQALNPALPGLVKQKYGAELRNQTLASIKPEISLALPSLMEEIRSVEETRALRTGTYRSWTSPSNKRSAGKRSGSGYKSCILCRTAGRPGHSTHYLKDCSYLPEADRRGIRSRLVTDEDENEFPPYEDQQDAQDPSDQPSALLDDPSARRVNVVQSPVLTAFYKHYPVRLTLDTGATTNMVKASFARGVNIPISPASQFARQADGVTPLEVVGEVHCNFTREHHTFQLDALVVQDLDVDILAGTPFMSANDIATRPAKKQIVINGTEIVHYGPQPNSGACARRTQAYLIRAPEHHTVVFPGDFVELSIPTSSESDTTWALEPRFDTPVNAKAKLSSAWPPPQEITSVGHSIRIPNNEDSPILLKKHEHLCQVRAVCTVDSMDSKTLTPDAHASSDGRPKSYPPYSQHVSMDPDSILPAHTRKGFEDLHLKYDDVFNPQVSKYNGASGKIEAAVNMGPVLPPQRKGRLPQYDRDRMVQLQKKFDELEESGVFAKPEQVNVTVEYLNLSFLVAKPNGGSRLVTSFGEVGHYSKPQPSLMPNVDNTLRDLARWNYIIQTDLLQSFYQIPLAHSSMKYCGVVTPFKGIRVYTRSAMGMPGSETCLEELMSRVLGDFIQEGFVAKIADDLYCGGNTPDELLANWSRVLDAIHRNNLRLSAKKTVICPKSTTILGWVWCNGTLQASPHRLAALGSVSPPQTVQGLRSYVGAFKVLSRVMRGYASLLDPLDQATAGKQSKDSIEWSDELLAAFRKSQQALTSSKVITMPRPEDTLWIVTDGSVKSRGIAATLFVLRKDKLLLAGFFNAKLRKHQVSWLPCEIEALCIGSAIRHFAPYIIQSQHTTQVLTDSNPCVQAYSKLLRGEFSSSSRVTAFLSLVSRYHVQVQHISGLANLPADYASRNPLECSDQRCQICKFICETEDSVVRGLSIDDVVNGSTRMPFTSRAAWHAAQQDCPNLRRVHSHLTQGTRPTKKMTKITDVKRYLRLVTIASDGLLVVKEDKPFLRTLEKIVIPRQVLDGLLTAIHLRFSHPKPSQLKQVFNRYFYALDADSAIQDVSSSCHHCSSLKTIPNYLLPQSSEAPPDKIGQMFAADIMKRYRQFVLVLRETVSSYTLTCFVPSEKSVDLRDALVTLCSDFLPLGHTGISIRVDPAPAFVALHSDPFLKKHGIHLDIGMAKNSNKNPVAERAVEELGLECLHLCPEGSHLSATTLALATSHMNSRIRKHGLSAREIWTQRDQITGEQLPLEDRQIILAQHHSRIQNHSSSASSKAKGLSHATPSMFNIGDLVYLKCDGDKTRAREKYMVVGLDNDRCQLRKFTQSQFRSKLYNVRVQQCYPVSSTVKRMWPTQPMRERDERYVRDDAPIPECPMPQSHEDITLPSAPLDGPPLQPPTPPPDIVEPPVAPNPEPSMDIVTPSADTSNYDTPHRRSARPRKPPSWQESGDWEL